MSSTDSFDTFSSLKEKKEQFVTGHQGTTFLEVHNVIFFYIFNLVLLKSLQKYVPSKLLEPVFLVLLPCLGILHPWLVFPWFTIPTTIGLTLLAPSRTESLNKKETHPQSITVFRGILMLLTMFSILAVDFHAFPRRFAKTEVYGTSLMDIGVGLFVFMQGLVQGFRSKPRPIRFSLFFLGFLRLAMVKTLNYQEHISEYGLHWNFFFTLACLDVVDYFIGKRCQGMEEILAIVLLCVHQVNLTYFQVSKYIQFAPRVSLFDFNKEGIVSLPGYIALTLMARSLSHLFNWISLLRLGLSAFLSFLVLDAVIEPVSRRFTNAAFVCWITFTSCFFLFFLKLMEKKFGLHTYILNRLNQHLLVAFIVSNVFTGVVNLLINTLAVSMEMTYVILLSYMTLALGITMAFPFTLKRSSSSTSSLEKTK